MLELSLKTLHELHDGKVGAMFDQSLRRAMADCADRPSDKRARVITLSVAISPMVDAATGQLEEIALDAEVSNKVPKSFTRTLTLVPQRRGGGQAPALLFNPLSPDARQGTLYEHEEEEAE